jgi:hypothetical protein
VFDTPKPQVITKPIVYSFAEPIIKEESKMPEPEPMKPEEKLAQ